LILISGNTSKQRFWQRCLILLILILGGNAIFGIFILVRKVSPLPIIRIFDTEIFLLIFREIFINFCLGFVAWLIYRYLRNLACRRYFCQ
jgi:type III secretory pathway component EscT